MKNQKFVWKKAEELNRKDFLYLPRYNFIKDVDKIFVEYKTYCKNKFGKSKEKFIDNVEINVNNNFMRLIGLYLAEGHHYEGFESKHGYPSGYVGFSFSLKEEDFSKFVYETMGHHFFNYRKPTYRKSTIEFCYGKRIIRKFFGQFGSHANNKKIPEWVINLPQDKLKFLIKGMIEGDGCVSKYSINYSTVSKELAYGFRLILNKLGILCSIKNQGKSKDSVIDGRVIKSRFDLYSLSVSGDSARKLATLLDLKYGGGKKLVEILVILEKIIF